MLQYIGILLKFVLGILVITITSLLFYVTRTLTYWEKRNVPGPKPLFFFGNMKDAVLRKKHHGDIFIEIYKQFKDEKLVGFYRMSTPFLLVKDLDLIKDIMIKNFDNFADRGVELSMEGFGANLFHANEDIWRLLRSRFSPIFTSGKVKNMFHLLNEQCDVFVNYLKKDAGAIEYEIKTIIQKYAIATISACAFGIDVDLKDDEKMDFFSKIDERIFVLNYFNELDHMFPGILKQMNLSIVPNDISDFFKGLVKQMTVQRNGKPSGRKDFMDLILELQQNGGKGTENKGSSSKIADEVIAAQAFIFYAAGYETSATTMTYLLHQLAHNQDIQDKLIAEVDEVVKKYEGQVTYDAVSEMTYLNKVFKETLRMCSSVDALQRRAKADYTFPGTQVTIRKGQVVVIPLLGIHRDEKYYANPEVFDPERFSAENVADRHPCAYLPFGTGPRNCIGLQFGKQQSLLCVVKLMMNFRLEPSPKTPKILTIDPARGLYCPKGGVYLNFIPRNHFVY